MSTASVVFMLVVMGFVTAMMLWTLQRTLFPPRNKPYEVDYPEHINNTAEQEADAAGC